jgi:hypothetical protein
MTTPAQEMCDAMCDENGPFPDRVRAGLAASNHAPAALYAMAVKLGGLEGQYIADIAKLPVGARDAEVLALTRMYAAKGLD